MDTIAERVARGAALLDERRPGWAGEVNAERLEMNDCYECVLGQLFGGFIDGWAALDLDDKDTPDCGFEAESHHNPPSHNPEYAALKAAWLAEIAARLEPAPAGEPEEALACV